MTPPLNTTDPISSYINMDEGRFEVSNSDTNYLNKNITDGDLIFSTSGNVHSFDLQSHNTTTAGLKLAGVLVESSADEMNYLASVTPGTAVANKVLVAGASTEIEGLAHLDTALLKLGGTDVTSSATELNNLDGAVAGVATASKALVLDGTASAAGFGSLDTTLLKLGGLDVTATATELNKLDNAIAGVATASKALVLDGTASAAGFGSLDTTLLRLGGLDVTATATELNNLDGAVAGVATVSKALVLDSTASATGFGTLETTLLQLSGVDVTATAAELNVMDGAIAGTATSGKALVADSSKNIAGINSVDTVSLSIGGVALTTSATEINTLDGAIAGTAVADKALVVDSLKDIVGINVLEVADLKLNNVSVSASAPEINVLTGVTPGTVIANKALVVDASKRINFEQGIITNLALPVSTTDAASKEYVDSVAQGLDVKAAARVTTVSELTLTSPGATIDGITMVVGDRVLVKNQSNSPENGIYDWASPTTSMVRSSDADSNEKVPSGMFVFIQEGTINSNSGWVLTTSGAVVLGTTPLSFEQFSGIGSVVAGNGIIKSGNRLDIQPNGGVVILDDSIILSPDNVTIELSDGTTTAVLQAKTGAVVSGSTDLVNSNDIFEFVVNETNSLTNKTLEAPTLNLPVFSSKLITRTHSLEYSSIKNGNTIIVGGGIQPFLKISNTNVNRHVHVVIDILAQSKRTNIENSYAFHSQRVIFTYYVDDTLAELVGRVNVNYSDHSSTSPSTNLIQRNAITATFGTSPDNMKIILQTNPTGIGSQAVHVIYDVKVVSDVVDGIAFEEI
jgi:hypothetical protein